MAYRIKLARFEVSKVIWPHGGDYRMRIVAEAAEGDGLDPNIFVYQRGPVSPYHGQTIDHWVAIAGPSQIADIPIGEPDPQHCWPFFRLSYAEQDFSAESLALEVWEIVKREAGLLCTMMGRFTQLSRVEELWVNTPPAEETGNSQSNSASEA